jgi:alanine racemase
MKIGILPIGYADGIKRSLSNGNGKFYVNGTPCEIVGNVCMDMCMIDLTGVMCEEGKEVILFENNEQLNQLARDMGTISYEVFTGISSRVKRVFVEE